MIKPKENRSLKEINLRDNEVGADGAKSLAEALLANKTLKALDLYNNRIGDEGAKELAKALTENASPKEMAKALKENNIEYMICI